MENDYYVVQKLQVRIFSVREPSDFKTQLQ